MFPDDLIDHLFQTSGARGEIYALLDGARDPQIHALLPRAPHGVACLYRGKLGEALRRAAPQLVRLSPMASFTEELLAAAWGHSWCIFLSSRAPGPLLERHLRRFLMVKDERGASLYFRYYDPRVLRPYLPTCTAEELELIFGPMDRLFAESEDGRDLIEYRLSRAGDGAPFQLAERRLAVARTPRQVAARGEA